MLKRKLIETLKQTINSLEKDLEKEKELNRYLRNDCVALLQNEMKSRKEIVNLENNLEFVTNNICSRKLKELVQRSNQN